MSSAGNLDQCHFLPTNNTRGFPGVNVTSLGKCLKSSEPLRGLKDDKHNLLQQTAVTSVAECPILIVVNVRGFDVI